jgi:hypothetical protein
MIEQTFTCQYNPRGFKSMMGVDPLQQGDGDSTPSETIIHVDAQCALLPKK